MTTEVSVRQNCKDLLESIGDEQIARYCYENDMMTKEQALEVVGTEENLIKHDKHCYIDVWTDDVLDQVEEDYLYDYLKENYYDFPKEYVSFEPEEDKFEWMEYVKETFSKLYTRVYDKEELKKEICKAIDFYLI